MKRLLMVLVGALSMTVTSPEAVPAASGDLDPTFGDGGKVLTGFPTGFGGDGFGEARAVAIQPDGKIVVVGTATSPAGNFKNFALARYNADGSLDTSFGGGVVFTDLGTNIEERASAVLIQPDGKIVAGGGMGNDVPQQAVIVRYNTDGSLDPTFDTGGTGIAIHLFGCSNFERGILALARQSDGKFVAAVDCSSEPWLVARFNSNGSLDTGFGTDGVASPFGGGLDLTLALQADDKIVVGSRGLARLDANGHLDPTFGGDGRVETDFDVLAVAVQADGKIVAAGGVGIPCGPGGPCEQFALARYNTNGTLDPSFGTDGLVTTPPPGGIIFAAIIAITLQPDGKIVAVGSRSTQDAWTVARYNTNGTLDQSFGSAGLISGFGFDFPLFCDNCGIGASAVALQADGKIVVAGTHTIVGGEVGRFALARYLNDAGSPESATGAGRVTFSTSAGTFANLSASLPPAGGPPGVTFPFGLFDWTVTGLTSGQTITVTMTYPSPIPVGAQYWKVIGGVLTNVTSLLGSDNGDNVLTLTITDGGFGDADGLANGQISDPGGVGIAVVTKTPAELLAELQTLIDSFNLKKRLDKKFDHDLAQARKSLAKGHIEHACKELKEIIRRAQKESGKKLTPDQAQQIIDKAGMIQTALGC